MEKLDFNNLEKYKAALDDGFSWSNANLKSPILGLTLQKLKNGKYTLGIVNFVLKESKIIISEENFKIFTEKVKVFFTKTNN